MGRFREIEVSKKDLDAIRRFGAMHREIKEANEGEKLPITTPAMPQDSTQTNTSYEQPVNGRLTPTKPNVTDEVLSLDEDYSKRL
jgi:hypothetical protein